MVLSVLRRLEHRDGVPALQEVQTKPIREMQMNEAKVIKALVDWSPHGLCDGMLVRRNGEQSKTEACAVGALALGFLYSPEGDKFVGKAETDLANFVERYLDQQEELPAGIFRGEDENEEIIPGSDIVDAMSDFYEMDSSAIDDIMAYNDNCIEGKDHGDALPPGVRDTIKNLRQKFQLWQLGRNEGEL